MFYCNLWYDMQNSQKIKILCKGFIGISEKSKSPLTNQKISDIIVYVD